VSTYHPAQAADRPSPPKRTPEEEAAHRTKMTALARWLWSETVPIGGTIAETYLWSRLLMMQRPPSTLRLHHALRLDELGKLPAMLGRIDHLDHGFRAVHVTFLHPSYAGDAPSRGPRMAFGPISGGAVRFGWPRPDRWLVVGEGIETTLSLVLAAGCPGWAALSARGILRLKLPPEARQVLIGADNDRDGGKAARRAKERWIAEGRRVRIVTPPTPGTDWNDVLRGRAAAAPGGRNAA
jgi:hypothetical protein